MKKLFLAIFILLVASGCSETTISDLKEPPQLKVKTASISMEAMVGTYCWNKECVDKEGASDLVKEEKAIDVAAGERIILKQQEELRPDNFFLTEINEESKNEKELIVNDFGFTAPTKKGVYSYGFTGTWYGKNTNEISNTAQYAFKLNVK